MSVHLNELGLAVHGLVLASTSKKSTASSSSEIILILLIFAALYFLFIRPRSQRARQAQQRNQQAGVGDEVMLTSGIIGRITEIDGDRASVEIAPDIEVEVVRRAIGQILVPADQGGVPDSVRPLDDDEHDEADGDHHDEADDDDAVVDARGPAVSPADEEDDSAGAGDAGAESDDDAEPAPGSHIELGGDGSKK
jgi:preprotein translocase subunit YajC